MEEKFFVLRSSFFVLRSSLEVGDEGYRLDRFVSAGLLSWLDSGTFSQTQGN